MPMDFPDMDSLKHAAKRWQFRQPNDGELESAYRDELANFVQSKDMVESGEIRNKVGWDQWDDLQKMLFVYDIKHGKE